MTRRSRFVAIASVAFCSSLAASARAQRGATDAAATAEALFDDAKQLMRAGKYAEACVKFEQSQRLDAGVGTLIYLADCYEKTHRAASAWVTFLEAAAAARVAGESDREKLARSRAAALKPTLAKLVIEVPETSELPGLVIRRGDTEVAKPLWGTALPVDAGEQVVRAEAPGHIPWTQRVTLADGAAPVKVAVPLLEAEASSGPTHPTAEAPPRPVPVEPPHHEEPPPSPFQRTSGFVVSGIGVVAAGIGTYFFFHARSQHDEALSHCNPNCDDTARSLQTDASHSATIGNIAVIGGAVLFAGGVTLVVTAPSQRSSATLRIQPGVASAERSAMLFHFR